MNIFEFIKEKSASERKSLAKVIWPKMGEDAQYVSITKLVNGGFKTLRIEWVRIICEKLNITPNELFRYPWKKKVTIKRPRK